jgi:multicomponent Na+:H+ antiporter subunit D
MHITALPVFIPLFAAAALIAVRHFANRWFDDLAGVAAALATIVLCALILEHTAHGQPYAYWLGGWRPSHMVAIGISFSIDSIGAGLATFAALLVLAALLYSWRYFEFVDGLYHALMLVFLAAMVGFSLTGDLFDLFVFFELMSAAAYSLTAYKTEEQGPIQGAINFAITNSVAAYAILSGIGLLYARTGALNLAQIGAALALHHSDPLVLVAMTLIFIGFLSKAAAVPMHFWLADAYAVAPIPVCVLFSGVMTELGIYAIARIYWTVFAGPLAAHEAELRAILISVGTLTALWGGVMCFTQRHIKRMLAFSTISHIGVFLCGIGLLSADGLAGSAVYVIGQGLVKAALFMLSGVLLHRFATVDEYDLHGRGRGMRVTGALFALGGILLSAVPGGTLFFGKSLLDGASLAAGYPWLPAIYLVSSILTAGAVLRVAGRVFMGWGARQRADQHQASAAREREDEQEHTRASTPPLMLIVPGVLLAGAIVVGLIPGAVPAIERAAGHFIQRSSYVDFVLRGKVHFGAVSTTHVRYYDYIYGAGATLGAVALAALALFGAPLRRAVPAALFDGPAAAVMRLRRLHSGHIGDYIAWWTAGAATIGGAALVFLR